MAPPADNTAPVQAGDLIAGKYRVERVLGVGGMGVVVSATHLQLDQTVALKFMLPEVASQAEAVERFLREARAAVKLRSEHVARVFDVGTMDMAAGSSPGLPYMVMEYLEGTDLRRLVEGGPVSIEDAVTYLVQACDAVEEAHRLGIIHRDLKPENLFLTRRPNGTPLVKVLDFGISKMTGTGDDVRLTGTATIMGTPLFMAPEQMQAARNAEPRSDIWALGAILYELLTGRPPFGGENVTEICSAVLTTAPVPVRSLRRDVPADLEAAVLRCLRKSPAERFPTVGDLAAALLPFAPVRASRVAAPPSDEAKTLVRASTAGGARGTDVSWGGRIADRPVTRRRPWLPVALASAVVVGGAGTALGVRYGTTHGADTGVTEIASVVAAPGSAPTSPPPPTPVVEPAAPTEAPSLPTAAEALPAATARPTPPPPAASGKAAATGTAAPPAKTTPPPRPDDRERTRK